MLRAEKRISRETGLVATRDIEEIFVPLAAREVSHAECDVGCWVFKLFDRTFETKLKASGGVEDLEDPHRRGSQVSFLPDRARVEARLDLGYGQCEGWVHVILTGGLDDVLNDPTLRPLDGFGLWVSIEREAR